MFKLVTRLLSSAGIASHHCGKTTGCGRIRLGRCGRLNKCRYVTPFH
nr:MAG TPA: hypothetical protein [Caudoviricetes sp.]